jgi:hypothetical protein
LPLAGRMRQWSGSYANHCLNFLIEVGKKGRTEKVPALFYFGDERVRASGFADFDEIFIK